LATKLSETASKTAGPPIARVAKFSKETARFSKEASNAAIKAAEPHVARAGKFSKEASNAAIEAIKPHLATAAKLSKEASNTAIRTAVKAAEPHIAAGVVAGNELYNQHLKESIDKHVLPLNDKYLQPALKEANGRFLKPALKNANAQLLQGKSIALQGRADMVLRFKSICRDIKGELRQKSISPKMMKMMKVTCNEPEKLVDTYLYLILFVFILIFRKSLKRIILFPFQIIWYFSPLRFIFGYTLSKSVKVKIKKKNDYPTSSKSVKVKSGKKKRRTK